jgi:phosphoglycolate phosphatase
MKSAEKPIILWDIDGTLLTTIRPFKGSIHKKVLLNSGFSIDSVDFNSQGFSDSQIIEMILRLNNIQVNSSSLSKILTKLDQESLESDAVSSYSLCPGISNELFASLASNFTHGILTGNTSFRGKLKLRKTPIGNYLNSNFTFFCEPGEKRSNIAERANNMIREFGITSLIIVGDTPSDITVANQIGALSISVASGHFSLSELEQHDPDLLISDLNAGKELFFSFLNSLV